MHPKQPLLSAAEEDNPHSCSNIPFHLFFSDCSLCFSPLALNVCRKLQGVQGVFLSEVIHWFPFLSDGLPLWFQWQISLCYWALQGPSLFLIEIPALRNVIILSITVLFECNSVYVCHDFKKHLAAVLVILVCGCVMCFPFHHLHRTSFKSSATSWKRKIRRNGKTRKR